MSFSTNIFINCPFDKEYKPLLKSLVFTIIYLGFEPKLSTTASSGHQRIDEIMNLINTCKFSIHDISRCEPLKTGDLPRFNMPYEMGLDIGCFKFGNAQMRSKRCLILEKVKNRYDIVISDISGQDIKEHNNKPKKLVEKVLDWFTANGAIPINNVPSLSTTWTKFQDCNAKVEVGLATSGFTASEIKNLSIQQYIASLKSTI